MPRSLAWPVAAVGIIVWKGDSVLLVRRAHPPRQGCWSLPGGHQEAGETVSEAATREIREEAGITIEIKGLAGVVDLIERDQDDLAHHYTVVEVAAAWISGEITAGDDASEAIWAPTQALERYHLPDLQRRIIELSVQPRTALLS